MLIGKITLKSTQKLVFYELLVLCALNEKNTLTSVRIKFSMSMQISINSPKNIRSLSLNRRFKRAAGTIDLRA